MATLNRLLRHIADIYPAVPIVWTTTLGLRWDEVGLRRRFKYVPSALDLFGPHVAGEHPDERYNQSFVAAGIGELVTVRTLTYTPKPVPPARPIPFPRWRAPAERQPPRLEAPRQLYFSDILRHPTAPDNPVSVLQYSTLFRGTAYHFFHTDAFGRPGNMTHIAQTLPDKDSAAALEAIEDDPWQARRLARYILEDCWDIPRSDYREPDFLSLAKMGITKLIVGSGEIEYPEDGAVVQVMGEVRPLD